MLDSIEALTARVSALEAELAVLKHRPINVATELNRPSFESADYIRFAVGVVVTIAMLFVGVGVAVGLEGFSSWLRG